MDEFIIFTNNRSSLDNLFKGLLMFFYTFPTIYSPCLLFFLFYIFIYCTHNVKVLMLNVNEKHCIFSVPTKPS